LPKQFSPKKVEKKINNDIIEDMENLMEKIISLCKRRGFIFPSSEIYGGIQGFYDYGPIGVELKNNIKKAWWENMVWKRDDIVGLDAAIIMHPSVWKASGHVDSFTDPLAECKNCHLRFRADHLISKLRDSGKLDEHGVFTEEEIKDMNKVFQKIKCPECGGDFVPPRKFNLMFKTSVGPVEDAGSIAYLRPETAQGIFVNYKNILDTARVKIPFGIAQIGKAFRNEITPGNFTFRTREFEQMEIEYFVKPGTDEKWHQDWIKIRMDWYYSLGIRKENLRVRPHQKDELAHYAKACVDVEYKFPFGWSELEGIANRTDFDLKQHQKFTGKDLSYFDEKEQKSYIPYVIEPSAGVDRTLLAVLVDAYHEEMVKGVKGEEKRVVLKFSKKLAPIKVAVLPLIRNRPELVEKAKEVYQLLKPHFVCQYDELGSIGRRYRRQDEIGTPLCLTIDFDTLKDDTVTIRDRDTMEQERVKIGDLVNVLKEKLES
jgi:glycyl-tRNA synthetase